MSYWQQGPAPPQYAGPSGYPTPHPLHQPPLQQYPPAGYGDAPLAPGPGGPPFYAGPPQPQPYGHGPMYPPVGPMHQHQPMKPPQQPIGPSYHQLATDPNVFRNHYRAGLQILTFNSKQTINELTDLAAQHVGRMSNVVAKSIEDHLQTTDPSYKLPAMYLIDSICKNIGGSYIVQFGRFIERAFLQAFHEVDPPTRRKLEELLGTWRTGGPNGTELFPGRVQRELESQLFGRNLQGGGIADEGRGVNASAHFLSGVQQLPTMAPSADRARVLAMIQRLLSVKRTQALVTPSDQTVQSHVKALTSLETVVSSNVSSEQLSQIEAQLTTIEAEVSGSYGRGSSTPQPEPVAPLGPPNLADLLSSLTVPAAFQAASASLPPPPPRDVSDDREDAYARRLLDAIADLQLTTASLQKLRPAAAKLLYDDLSLQCSQCGIRYLESPRARGTMQAHLDRHFQHKRRLNDAARAQSRNWFSLESEWIEPPLVVEAPNPLATKKADTAATPAKVVATVKVPKDATKASRPCPICKEPFDSQYSDRDDDFVFVDALEENGVIFHESCFNEARALRLAAKLEPGGFTPMSPSRSQTRETTPVTAAIANVKLEAALDDVASLTAASTPTSLGKRKASEALEGDDEIAQGEEDDAEIAAALTTASASAPPPDVKPVIAPDPPAVVAVEGGVPLKRIKTEEVEPPAPPPRPRSPSPAVNEQPVEQPLFAEDDDPENPFGA